MANNNPSINDYFTGMGFFLYLVNKDLEKPNIEQHNPVNQTIKSGFVKRCLTGFPSALNYALD